MIGRRSASTATAVAIGCLVGLAGCPRPAARPPAAMALDDTAIRIRVANAEARRAGGVVELVELATHGAKHERLLALRGLGRTGGAIAIARLRTALADGDPQIVAAAAAGLGIAAALDEEGLERGRASAPEVSGELVAALARAGDHADGESESARESVGVGVILDVILDVILIEALGRAGTATAQSTLHAQLAGSAPIAEAAAIALGRHGRRELALSDEARDALARVTDHADAGVRYAAVWALSREHLPGAASEAPRVVSVTGKLVARLADPVAEIRAQAIAALARRKLVPATAPAIEQALVDRDWRVAVEAVRALTGKQSSAASRAAVAAALARQLSLVEQGEHAAAHVIVEGLRGLAVHAQPAVQREAITSIAETARASASLPALTRGWVDCLATAALIRGGASPQTLERCGHDKLPDHLRLPLLGELVTAGAETVATRREALRTLLAHADVRVRAAGLGALAALWPEGDAADHRAAVSTLAAALGSQDPILAGSATEAAPAIYDLIGRGDRSTLDAAVVARARGERDVELAAALYGVIGKQAIGSGAEACREGLAGHPVLANAAAECLRLLGDTPTHVPAAPALVPPVDVTAVIGRAVRWRLATSRGELVIELSPEVAPWAVATIVALTRRGYYDGLEIHRVVPDFVVQGGDPTESGWGGPGFTIPAEPASAADGPGFVTGAVGIADAGRDSGGSQWFVMHARAPHLDGRYTWVGRVTEGSADALLIGDRIVEATVEITPR